MSCGGDAEVTPAQLRYRASVDVLAADAAAAAAAGANCGSESAEWCAALATVAPEARFDANAARKVRFAMRRAVRDGRCPYCWVGRDACFCHTLPDISPACPAIHWVLLCHHQELLRATSTGKLVSQVLGGEFLVHGAPPHRQRIAEVLADPRTRLLFPDDRSGLLAAEAATAAAARPPAVVPSQPPDAAGAALIVVALDGTWGQARQLFKAVNEQQAGLRCVRLRPSSACGHSSLFNALRQQSEAGRVCTLEACALLLAEAQEEGWAVRPGAVEELLLAMRHMVDVVANEKHVAAPFGSLTAEEQRRSVLGQQRRHVAAQASGASKFERRGANRQTDVEMEQWIAALQRTARSTPPPSVRLRHCCVCATVLQTPLRLPEHLHGRKHCCAVAERHLGRRLGSARADAGLAAQPEIPAAEAAEVYERLSTLPLAAAGLGGAAADVDTILLRFAAGCAPAPRCRPARPRPGRPVAPV
eukprot:TRINITY_DN4752_c2_g3_i1.p1 TRINITY_DN4752_c2_g3~~TRINITY_DN4752_c2_g3_i1.p1  ORF type:complete len:475 (+),score=158.74 TRINITY_DN4752_c2_g3_i1:82-1506(+)